MGKDARPRVLADNQARAVATMVRSSPRKLNLVAQSIRGKKAEAALQELTFSPKRVAKVVKKVLQSAIANAENNHDLDVDDLVVKEASVGKNLVMKRFHARARGRGARVERPFSQVTIVVEEFRAKAPPPPKKSKKPAAGESAGEANTESAPKKAKGKTAAKAQSKPAAKKSGKKTEKA
jgi:large subunit ribosomal protein L22